MDAWMGGRSRSTCTHHFTLQGTDEHGLQELPGILGVTHIIKRFCRVFSRLGKKDLVSTRVLLEEIGDVVYVAVDGHPAVGGLAVLGHLGCGNFCALCGHCVVRIKLGERR